MPGCQSTDGDRSDHTGGILSGGCKGFCSVTIFDRNGAYPAGAGLSVDIIDSQMPLDDYQVVILPDCIYHNEDLKQKMEHIWHRVVM